MRRVDFQVVCLQVGGGRKISEVQVRVVIIGRDCLVFFEVQVTFFLADAVF